MNFKSMSKCDTLRDKTLDPIIDENVVLCVRASNRLLVSTFF